MTPKGTAHDLDRPPALPAKATTADLGTLVDQLMKLSSSDTCGLKRVRG